MRRPSRSTHTRPQRRKRPTTAAADRGTRPPRRRAGRPSREAAGQLVERILEAARALFLADGYGATSVEAIAKHAGVSKRTFYARFDDKAQIFEAMLHDVVDRLRPATGIPLVERDDLRANLERIAKLFLSAALTPDALALHRLIVAESVRFPNVAAAVNRQAAGEEAVALIAPLLIRERRLDQGDADFAARQFLHMVIAIPQRRAMGLEKPLSPAEIRKWPERVVALFLEGVGRG